ncbi:hypothetical protein HUT16_15200 [Kitasatospora sp. NA04385]|uniref:hypothetical protein n=1 Tax=Kitasatospora sp. NA04385 TaxID=2742135 RepID=UPI0015912B24|nr:hypothetical protein [Kitasatospora sp. NA04385]QKW20232.1 hypothetical protein HUT16_15200 [Kitasatospora sp. NA04385]
MTTNQKFTVGGFQVNRRLLTAGAALTGVGAVVALAGTALVCTALVSAGRGWVRTLETHPAEMAQRTFQQAKAASAAGREAWRSSVN